MAESFFFVILNSLIFSKLIEIIENSEEKETVFIFKLFSRSKLEEKFIYFSLNNFQNWINEKNWKIIDNNDFRELF